MKKVLQVLTILVLSYTSVSAQWVTDSVSMGPGYSNNIFYGMGTGVQKTSPASNWHIAFSMNGKDSASVFANQQGNSTQFFTRVYNINRPITAWDSVTQADTLGSALLYNGDKSWYQGAFNDVPSSSVVDFGWGTYDQFLTHKFLGTRLFIIETGGKFYKFAIDSMNPFTYDWAFRIESLSPSIPTQTAFTLSKANGYNDRIFAYFNIDSGAAYDREPAISTWDFQIVGYPTYIPAGPQSAWRAVQGVLTNRGTAVAKANMIDVDVAQTDYKNIFSPIFAPAPAWINNWENNPYTTIGYDWKTFDLGSFMYLIPDSVSYFISAKNDSVYQLQFLGFGGSMNGNIKFRYRNMGSSPVAVKDYETLGALEIFPNPATTQVNILLNAKENTEARLTVTALNGQVVINQVQKITTGLNALQLNTANLPTGNYVVSLQDETGAVHKKMTVIR